MNGFVDDDLRGLHEVLVSPSVNDPKSKVVVWIDTAFTGGLVLPRQEIERFGLAGYSSTPAILADGKLIELMTYTCYLE